MYSCEACCMRKGNATPKLLPPFWALVSLSSCHAGSSHELLAYFSYCSVVTSVENTVGSHCPQTQGTGILATGQTAGVVHSADSNLRMYLPKDRPPFLCSPLWPWNSQYALGDLIFLFKQLHSFQRQKLRAGQQRLSRAIKSV